MTTLVITRPAQSNSRILAELIRGGYEVVNLPFLETTPIALDDHSKQILQKFSEGTYSWLAFTSANGVTYFSGALKELGVQSSIPKGIKIATVGPKTGERVQSTFGVRTSLSPSIHTSEALSELFGHENISSANILLAVAKEGRDVLASALKSYGAKVTKLVVYETKSVRLNDESRSSILKTPHEDIIFVCFSPSAVKAVFEEFHADRELLATVKFASIGPVTSQAVKERKGNLLLEARDHSEEGLFAALLRV